MVSSTKMRWMLKQARLLKDNLEVQSDTDKKESETNKNDKK